jgi:hypothetical protein
MVINCSVAGWDLHKVLVDNGSQADITFLHAFDRMGISHSLLKPSDNPLYGFGGKGTFPVGKIELPLSFGVAPNARSEQITFDIVDMVYPYNAIMGRGSINKFEAAIHGLYLCMKIPGPLGAITVYDNQQTARNIERDFVPGQRNVHCLTAQREVPASASPTEMAASQAEEGVAAAAGAWPRHLLARCWRPPLGGGPFAQVAIRGRAWFRGGWNQRRGCCCFLCRCQNLQE